jgi:CBS domain-containing protein
LEETGVAEIGIRERMLVKDVMSSPVFTVEENASVKKVAQIME